MTKEDISSSFLSHLDGVGGNSFLMCVYSCTEACTRESARDLNSGREAVKEPCTAQYVTGNRCGCMTGYYKKG
jgi:hypothetical protein